MKEGQGKEGRSRNEGKGRKEGREGGGRKMKEGRKEGRMCLRYIGAVPATGGCAIEEVEMTSNFLKRKDIFNVCQILKLTREAVALTPLLGPNS